MSERGERTIESPRPPEPPKAPLIRIRREGDIGPECPLCGSSQKRKFWMFGPVIGCIQPKCENYYKDREAGAPEKEANTSSREDNDVK